MSLHVINLPEPTHSVVPLGETGEDGRGEENRKLGEGDGWRKRNGREKLGGCKWRTAGEQIRAK